MPSRTDLDAAASPATADRFTLLMRDEGVLRVLRVCSLGGLVAVLPLTLIAMAARAMAPLSDPDTWWHLVLGRRFLDGESIRHPGPQATFGTEDWRPRDWLSQVVAGQFDRWFGLPGVAWIFGAVLILLGVVLYRACRRQAGFAAATLATAVGLLAAGASLSARPQIVSFVLLVVTVDACLRTARDGRARWWLAALTGLWACLHGMWFLSPALQGVVILGLLAEHRLTRQGLFRLAGVGVLSVAAVAVTPNGAALLRRPFGSSLEIAEHIQEYDPPTLTSLFFVLTLAMIAVTILTWLRGERQPWTKVLLLAVATFFALQMLRTMALGALIAAPLFAQAVDTWLSRLGLVLSRKVERVLVYGTAALALVGLALVTPATADEPAPSLPVAFDRHLAQLPDGTVVFNELADGGYLLWRHPQVSAVEDGLSDQYSVQWHLDYFDAKTLRPGWREFVDRTGASYALLVDAAPLPEALKLLGWETVASADGRVLLRKPG